MAAPKDGTYKGQYSFMDVYLRRSTGWQAILSAVNRAEGIKMKGQ